MSLAVRKMMGVCRERSWPRIALAVSKPPIPGISTSSRTTANSSAWTRWRASSPERASTRFWPRSSRMARSERRLAGLSSTRRMLAFGSDGSLRERTRGSDTSAMFRLLG